ncbi:hypothetical protein EKO27_g1403 [Xylaria grammica]|uniref:Glycosyltransferase family 28 N-terminal domain-containing protein n=1 Tax=Xylaria grammica TaxID=363999 RepID=A0A439DH36_9PEZI|nr:hypothetical protein EKO27_g1403 [Xylaria grammica]
MSIVDEKRRADAARSGDHPRAGPALPLRGRTRTGSGLAPGLVVTDDGQNYSNGFLPESPDLVAEEEVPPAYSEFHDQLNIHQTGFDAGAAVTDDGRVNININQTSRHLADFIAPTLRSQLRHDARTSPDELLPPPYIPPSLGGQPGQTPPPQLNVVIQIVGSRGDVQPFIALGQVLKNTYHHRVRVATHATFQKFVEENGLEFFAIGGDPAELMAFMVKNPGLMPGMDALKSGEITKRRKGIEQIVMGCWRSCIETGDGLGPAPRFSRKDEDIPSDATPVMGDSRHKPFVADVIIANPPSFAHIHVAEKLGVPLHLMFTMPWSPTRAFPQPLANIQSSNTDPVTTNYLSYAMVEMMTWQGLGDVINRFRTKILDLEPLALIWAPGVLTRLRIPYTYCWSPALIPKPNDWGNHIDIAGFYFLNLASSYTPEPELAAFLAAGPPPVYIGFGSIVVDDPDGLTRKIFNAVTKTGVLPWYQKAGVGSVLTPWKYLTASSCLVTYRMIGYSKKYQPYAITEVLELQPPESKPANLQLSSLSSGINLSGALWWRDLVQDQTLYPTISLPQKDLLKPSELHLNQRRKGKRKSWERKSAKNREPILGPRAFISTSMLIPFDVPSRPAEWRSGGGYIRYSDLKLFRAKEYDTENHPTDPISACTSALVGDATTIVMAAADIPRDLFRAARGPSKSKSTENVASEDTSPQLSSDDATTPNASGPAGSDTASILSNTLSMHTSNSSALNLTPSTTSTSNLSTAPQQHNNRARATRAESVSSEGVNQQLERVLDTSKSINNIIATGVKSPMNFCMGLARGFRNAPNLYNDDTVRPTEKVTGFSSGLKVAGKEFGLGLYDGITGLVTQPLKGAEKEGGAGLLKGFGKGIGGLIFKSGAAVWGIPAYTMAGIHAEIRTMFAQSAHKYIVASRMSQGNEDFNASSAEEREDIEVRWLGLRDTMKGFYALKQKEKGKSRDASPSAPERASTSTENVDEPQRAGWFQNRNISADDRRLQEQKKAWKGRQGGGSFVEEDLRSVSTNSTRELDDEFEAAIQSAVQETSRGNVVEDAHIEQAIRSSPFQTLARHALDGFPMSKRPHDEKQQYPFSPDDLENITDEEYQALIEEAIKQSMMENHQQAIRMHDLEEEDNEDEKGTRRAIKKSQAEDPGRYDDEEYKRALEASQAEHETRKQHEHEDGGFDEEALRQAIAASQAEQEAQQYPDNDEELKRALEESEKVHQQELARVSSLKSEEDIVMEYVKKQSLAEAAFRNTKDRNANASEEDEELRRALEESMKTNDEVRGGSGGPSQS